MATALAKKNINSEESSKIQYFNLLSILNSIDLKSYSDDDEKSLFQSIALSKSFFEKEQFTEAYNILANERINMCNRFDLYYKKTKKKKITFAYCLISFSILINLFFSFTKPTLSKDAYIKVFESELIQINDVEKAK